MTAHLISLATAAEHLGVSTRTLRRRIAEGSLTAYRVGSLIRIDPAELRSVLRPIPNAVSSRSAA